MAYEHLLDKRDGDIVTITLNRPEKRNALAMGVLRELIGAFREVGASDARGVMLAANGPVFSAGHNFADMAGASLVQARELFEVCTEMMDAIQAIPQPVCAKVHALATAAGCQLVATCDLAVAFVHRAGRDGDVVACVGERECGGASDAPARTGDEGDRSGHERGH